jgi:hypothetical protein
MTSNGEAVMVSGFPIHKTETEASIGGDKPRSNRK